MQRRSTEDRLHIYYTSAIDEETRAEVLRQVILTLDQAGYHIQEHYDKNASAWTLDVTAYDPTVKPPVTDGEANNLLASVAEEMGISLQALLRAAEGI